MGMEIIAYDPYINQSQIFPYINFKELDEVYQLSDVISLHLPLLDSTVHMIDQHAFENETFRNFNKYCTRRFD